MSDVVCSRCGARSPAGAKFCSQCGNPISGGKIRCPKCKAKLDSAARFCGSCGSPVALDRDSRVSRHRWARGPGDFATRIEVEDLKGLFKKELIVEEGTTALLFSEGKLTGTLASGSYDFAGAVKVVLGLDKIKSATVLLVDAGDLELDFDVKGRFTKDPVKVDVKLMTIVNLENPAFFYRNVMKGRKSYSLHDLRSSIYDEVKDALQEVIGECTVEELSSNLDLKRSFELKLAGHLKTTFQLNGFEFVQVRTIQYTLGEYEKIRDIRQKVFLQVSEKEAELEGKTRLFDVLKREDVQVLVEETARVEQYEKRLDLWSRMRRAVGSDRMDEVRSEDELEAFLHEIDKSKLIRAEEMGELKRSFSEKVEDHDVARAHLLEKLEIEQKIERERIEALAREELEEEVLEVKLRRRRAELEAEVAEKRIKEAAKREEAIKDRQAELQLRLEKAKTEVEIRELEREQDRLDHELGLATLEKMKAIKLKEQREKMLLDLEMEQKRVEIESLKKDKEQDREIAKVKALSDVSLEALIATSGPEQAAMLAELRKTEQLKDMTEEQILALAAEKSPEVAKAFQDKFKSMGGGKVESLYEKMLEEKDKAAVMMKEVFEKAMDTQRDVSVAAASSAGGAGAARQEAEETKGKEAILLCPNCRAEVPAGDKHCSNCGNKI